MQISYKRGIWTCVIGHYNVLVPAHSKVIYYNIVKWRPSIINLMNTEQPAPTGFHGALWGFCTHYSIFASISCEDHQLTHTLFYRRSQLQIHYYNISFGFFYFFLSFQNVGPHSLTNMNTNVCPHQVQIKDKYVQCFHYRSVLCLVRYENNNKVLHSSKHTSNARVYCRAN